VQTGCGKLHWLGTTEPQSGVEQTAAPLGHVTHAGPPQSAAVWQTRPNWQQERHVAYVQPPLSVHHSRSAAQGEQTEGSGHWTISQPQVLSGFARHRLLGPATVLPSGQR
jgi:hypothetical protein